MFVGVSGDGVKWVKWDFSLRRECMICLLVLCVVLIVVTRVCIQQIILFCLNIALAARNLERQLHFGAGVHVTFNCLSIEAVVSYGPPLPLNSSLLESRPFWQKFEANLKFWASMMFAVRIFFAFCTPSGCLTYDAAVPMYIDASYSCGKWSD